MGGTIGCEKCRTDLEAKKMTATIEEDNVFMYVSMYVCMKLLSRLGFENGTLSKNFSH